MLSERTASANGQVILNETSGENQIILITPMQSLHARPPFKLLPPEFLYINMTEDKVRDQAGQILGFSDSSDAKSGVGQITSFNSLGFSEFHRESRGN